MTWNPNLECSYLNDDDQVAPEIDRIARRLATQAGADWDGMNNYPGFERSRWREQAEQILKVVSTDGPGPFPTDRDARNRANQYGQRDDYQG